MKIFNDWPAEQISLATHERKKMISMSKFFAGGGEMIEWKTAFTRSAFTDLPTKQMIAYYELLMTLLQNSYKRLYSVFSL